MNINVLIADDHPIVREEIRSVIGSASDGIEVIGEASNGKEVLEFSNKYLVDVHILDIVMPELNGIETSVKLLKSNPKSKIIILTIHSSKSLVRKALYIGVKGYVLKQNAPHDLIQAIQKVRIGHFYFSPAISEMIVKGFLSHLSNKMGTIGPSSLGEKERKILRLVVDGISDEVIVRKLNFPLSEVYALKENIKNKLGAQTQSDLIRVALEEGIP